MGAITEVLGERDVRSTMLRVAVVAAVLTAGVRPWVPVEYLAGLLVVPTLVFGPVVSAGAAAGVVVNALVRGSFGAWTVVDAAWTAALPYCTYVLWTYLGRPESDARRVGASVVAVGVAAVCTLAFVAWVTVVLGVQPFFTAHVALAKGAAVGAVLAAVAVFAFGRSESSPTVETADADTADGGYGRSATLAALSAVGLCWYALGTGIGAMTHDVRLFDNPEGVRAYAAGLAGTGTLGTVAAEVLAFLYAYGDVVVVLFGAVAVLAVARLWPRRVTRGRSRRTEQ